MVVKSNPLLTTAWNRTPSACLYPMVNIKTPLRQYLCAFAPVIQNRQNRRNRRNRRNRFHHRLLRTDGAGCLLKQQAMHKESARKLPFANTR